MQIQIAQSRQDEISFAEWVATNCDVQTVSKRFPEGVWTPIGLTDSCEQTEMIFLASHELFAKTNVYPMEDGTGRSWIPNRHGAFIEWERSTHHENVGIRPGRIYLPSPDRPSGAVFVDTKKLYQKIRRWIVKTYTPDEKGAFYVGPDLTRQSIDNTCHPVYGRLGGIITLAIKDKKA